MNKLGIYLLDTNIIIRLWNHAPYVLESIKNHKDIDFKVTNEVMQELVDGEKHNFFPKMAPKFQLIMKHMVSSPGQLEGKPYKENRFLNESEGKFTIITGNKISSVDYLMILTCQNNSDYKLVTEDTKMLKSSKLVLKKNQYFNYNEFIDELIKCKVINEKKA